MLLPYRMARLLNKGRCEAFSDGVIAVIITIMVLELKVPHEAGWAGLRGVLPTLTVYLISFFFVGTYWVNHHVLMDRVEKVGTALLWLNLLWLLMLSLVPFFTEYMGEHHMDSTSVILYALLNLAVGGSFAFLRDVVHAKLRQDNTLVRVALTLLAAVLLLWVTPNLGTHDDCTPHTPPVR
jgi:uncharacterized membrane protein